MAILLSNGVRAQRPHLVARGFKPKRYVRLFKGIVEGLSGLDPLEDV
jgi:hypothetical protein